MEIIVRATIVYGLLFFLFRGTRKRALAELSPFEMILLVTLGDIVQQGITQEDYSLTGAVLAAGTFAFWVTAMTWVSFRSPRARRAIEGVPLVIVENGDARAGRVSAGYSTVRTTPSSLVADGASTASPPSRWRPSWCWASPTSSHRSSASTRARRRRRATTGWSSPSSTPS